MGRHCYATRKRRNEAKASFNHKNTRLSKRCCIITGQFTDNECGHHTVRVAELACLSRPDVLSSIWANESYQCYFTITERRTKTWSLLSRDLSQNEPTQEYLIANRDVGKDLREAMEYWHEQDATKPKPRVKKTELPPRVSLAFETLSCAREKQTITACNRLAAQLRLRYPQKSKSCGSWHDLILFIKMLAATRLWQCFVHSLWTKAA